MTATLQLDTATGVDIALPLAGLGSRAYAYLIDWHIRIVVVLLWVLGWLVARWPDGFTGLTEDRSAMLWLISVPSLFYMLYHPIVELCMHGNSPGKQFAGIRCIDSLGNAPSSGAILLRNIMRLIDGLPVAYTVGVVAMLLTKEQVRLGDMVADTRMVVAPKDSEAMLNRVGALQSAQLPAAEAELVVELLERWDVLHKDKRRRYAATLLARVAVQPKKTDKLLKVQLQKLLTPAEAD